MKTSRPMTSMLCTLVATFYSHTYSYTTMTDLKWIDQKNCWKDWYWKVWNESRSQVPACLVFDACITLRRLITC